MLGSTLYKLTWKVWAMPSGRSRFRLRGSVLRTSATAATGSLPTPWPTPQARDFKGAPLAGIHDRGAKGAPLNETARLASWPTPTSCDSNRKPAANFTTTNLTLNHGAALASWPTPRAADGLKGAHLEAQTNMKGTDLPTTASWTMAGWQTPCVDGFRKRGGNRSDELGNQELVKNVDQPARLTVTGELLTGSSAGMASGGQLNPAHSRWLMGYPAAWDSCGATAMQSISSRPRPSSKRSKIT